LPTITTEYLHASREHTHDAEPRLRALLDAAVDAIVTIDQHGIIDSVNPATERIFGYSAREMLGSNVSMLMPSPHREQHDRFLQRYLMTGEAHIVGIGREIEARRKDGSVFPVDLTVSEFEIDDERMFTGLIRDISDRRAAERAAQDRLEELAHAGRLADLGMTTSTIAHEVNQPLTAIVSFAHACQRILDSVEPDTKVLREALGQIAEQAERASAIINRIRNLAKKRDSSSERVDVNESARNVLSILARQLRDAHISLHVDLAPQLPAVIADAVHVEQVVMNLVINAIDAMREGPSEPRQLHVSTIRDNDSVRLSVRDTGPGLHEEEAARIFDSFYSTKPDGMGVGLSICRNLAENHHGQLWVEPRPDDGGATFNLTLPVAK
jgi:two-component system sensor kinase FixL